MGLLNMEKSGLMQNPYVVFGSCIVFAAASLSVLAADGRASILVFLLSALAVIVIRPVRELSVKALSYVLVGMLGYWMLAHSFVSPGLTHGIDLQEILVISVFCSLVGLVAYFEGRVFGHAFAGGSLVLLFFAGNDIDSLAAAVLVIASANAVAHFASRIGKVEKLISRAATGSALSGIFLFGAGLFKTGITAGTPMPDILAMGLSLVYSVLANLLFILCVLGTFEFALGKMKLRRIEGEYSVEYVRSGSGKGIVPKKR